MPNHQYHHQYKWDNLIAMKLEVHDLVCILEATNFSWLCHETNFLTISSILWHSSEQLVIPHFANNITNALKCVFTLVSYMYSRKTRSNARITLECKQRNHGLGTDNGLLLCMTPSITAVSTSFCHTEQQSLCFHYVIASDAKSYLVA